jgi:hypothetical protein
MNIPQRVWLGAAEAHPFLLNSCCAVRCGPQLFRPSVVRPLSPASIRGASHPVWLLSLDHVVIAVRDLETAGRVYADLELAVVPGGRHPEGRQNSAVSFSGGGYLELLSPYDSNLPGGKEIAELLKRGEGAIGAGLEIPSGENAARTLRASGVKVEGPTAGSIVLNGETKEPTRRWSTVDFPYGPKTAST